MNHNHKRTMSLSGKFAAVAFAVISLAAPAQAQWSIMKADADSLVKSGSDHIYNLQFDRANEDFKKVIAMYPNHPAPYFMDAMVDWWRIKTAENKKDQAMEQSFLSKIDKTIAVADKLLEENQYDVTGLFFKAGALGYRGRLYAESERWVKAAGDGNEALGLLQKSQRIAPGNHDILLGTGLYNYLAAALPEKYPALKTVLFFLPKGDKQIGLAQLIAASNKARYANTEAKVVLLQVYSMFEKNPDELLKLSTELHAKYPSNGYFHWYLAQAYQMLGYGEQSEQTWRDILKNALDKKPGYSRAYTREALYYVGTSLMNKGEYEDALKYLYKADEASRALDQDPSGFIVLTNLKIGQIMDIQGKRDLAIKQYNKVLAWPDKQNSKQLAEQYIQKPFGK